LSTARIGSCSWLVILISVISLFAIDFSSAL
jgi:hypothetical protein